MIKFRAKEFSAVSKTWEGYRKNMPAILATASLGVSSANYLTNRARHKNDAKYQGQQLDAMNKLTRELKNTVNSMNTVNNSINSKFKQQQVVQPERKKRGFLGRIKRMVE